MTPCKTLLRAHASARIAQGDRIQPAGEVVAYAVGESSAGSQNTPGKNNFSARVDD